MNASSIRSGCASNWAGNRGFLLSFILCFILFLVPVDALSYTHLIGARVIHTPEFHIEDAKDHDRNRVFLRINNNGVIGLDIQTGNGRGFWPTGTSNNYVFGSGLWFGGKADVDADGDLDKVFVQGYNPLAGDSEFDPGRLGQDPEDPLARIFDSTDPTDLLEWPLEFRDPDSGEPLVFSPQDFVTIYNDVSHLPTFGISNLGIEVRQRSLAFVHDLSTNVIYIEWDLTNVSEAMENGPYVFRDAWIGYDMDADVGVAFADDLASFFREMVTPEGDTLVLDTSITWDSDFVESNFIGTPGFLGLALIRSPGNPNDGIDNDGDGLTDESPFNGFDDDGDGETDESDEVDELGLVNFSEHCNPSSPCEVIDPMADSEGYDLISCISEANPDSSSRTVCYERTDPSDLRFMISSGPFDWHPGETVRVLFAFVFAPPAREGYVGWVGDPPRPDPNDPIFTDFIATVLEARRFARSGYTDYGVLPSVHNVTNIHPTNIPFFDYPLSVSIFDTVGIARASLFYTIDGGGFESIDLTTFGNTLYTVELPGPGFGSRVDFYYEAVDSLFRVSREPEDAPQTTLGYDVVRLPDFIDVTEEAGIGTGSWNQSGMAVADYDDDGDPDVYFVNSHDLSALYRNEGGGTFQNVTGSAGLGNIRATCAAWADYDNDGYLDLFVSGGGREFNNLFHSNGDGTFTDLADSAGVESPGHMTTFSWSDYDNDGYVDLYLFSRSQDASERNAFFRNNGDGTFSNIAPQVGLDFYWAGSYPNYRTVVWVDADTDGWSDLFLTDPQDHIAHLFRNNRDGTFTDIAGESDLIEVYSNPVLFSDYDNDGDLDLITGGGNFEGGVYTNEGDGRFTDVTEQYAFDRGVFIDLNNSGLLDVISPLGNYNGVFYLNRGDEFIEVSSLFGGEPFPHFGFPLSFDYDVDGDLDILTLDYREILFRNEGFAPEYTHNWFHVKCLGTSSNRAALGTKVRVMTGDLTQTRVVGGARSNVQESLLAEFGVGDAFYVDRLVVEWPSGKVQELTGLTVNRVITIVEDSTLVGIGDGTGSSILPKAFSLSQNYPNPFNPSTTIRYDIPVGREEVPVKIRIYDVRGRLIRTLVDREEAPGRYQVHWNGRDDRGRSVSSGVYLYRIEAEGFASVRKMVMFK